MSSDSPVAPSIFSRLLGGRWQWLLSLVASVCGVAIVAEMMEYRPFFGWGGLAVTCEGEPTANSIWLSAEEDPSIPILFGLLFGWSMRNVMALIWYLSGQLVRSRGTLEEARLAASLSMIPISVLGALHFFVLTQGERPAWLEPSWGLPIAYWVLLLWFVVSLLHNLKESLQLRAGRLGLLLLLWFCVAVLVVWVTWYLTPMQRILALMVVGLTIFALLVLLLIVGGVSMMATRSHAPIWLIRLLTRSRVRSPRADSHLRAAQGIPRFILFPYSQSIGIIGSFVIVLRYLDELMGMPFLAEAVSWNCMVIASLFLCLAAYWHFRPDSNRYLKYEMALTAVTIAFLGRHTFAMSKTIGFEITWDKRGELVGMYITIVLWPWLSGLITSWRYRRSQTGPPSRGWRIAYRITCAPITFLTTGFVLTIYSEKYAVFLPVVLTLLMVRYVAFRRLLQTPFVYLRSFHDRESTLALGHIVSRAVYRHGPVVALTHSLQPPEEIYARQYPDQLAQLSTSTDENWQQWVIDHLGRARGVIFDATLGTEGLQWEIQTALEMVAHEKIVLLAREDFDVAVPEKVKLITYGLTWREKRAARREMKEWLEAIP